MQIRTPRELAGTIRGARMRAGLTQEQLAEACGLSRRTIGDLEAARSTPRFGALLAICDALHLTLSIDQTTNATSPGAISSAPIDLDALLGDA